MARDGANVRSPSSVATRHGEAHCVHHRDLPLHKEFIRPIGSTSPPSTMSRLFDAHIAVDSTFIPLPRSPFKPKNILSRPRSPRGMYRSPATSPTALSMSKVERGAEADTTVLLHSGLLEQATEDLASLVTWATEGTRRHRPDLMEEEEEPGAEHVGK